MSNGEDREMTQDNDDMTQLDIDGLLDKYFGGRRGSLTITTDTDTDRE